MLCWAKPICEIILKVGPSDLSRLDDGEFLNDTIIDYYCKCGPPFTLPQCLL